VAITLQRASPTRFDRHIKRLVWCALIGSLALLIPVTQISTSANSGLVGGLGAMVVVVAGLAVVRDVSRYVRSEAARRVESTRRSRHYGACQAAEVIQDRVGNLLSLTVGYVDFLFEDEQLSDEGRKQAEHALESALAATRAVSTFRQSLGCGASSLRDWHAAVVEPPPAEELARIHAARLVAQGPAMRDALGEVQYLLAALLATPRPDREAERLRTTLEHMNELLQKLERT
jgi:hypothetical protein